MTELILHNLLWTQGLLLIIIFLIVAVLGLFTSRILIYLSLVSFIFALFFFRNPPREYEKIAGTIPLVSPADGKIVDISVVESINGENYYQIAIFLSPLDVHVNRIPTEGIVEKISYKQGAFVMAFLPKSSELNESNEIIIKTSQGHNYKIRQIAGTIARTICCWIKEGNSVATGSVFGMIKCGSRVELIIPTTITLHALVGDYVYGGQTILGAWHDNIS